jgi:tRNA A-37 threonylcarbamoyl transferase component Bud32
MAESQKCPQCGSRLPPDAPHGVCPRCVLGLGLPGESAADVTAPLASRFALPTNEELVSLFPSLEILGLVGQGGMGAVYKARQPHLDRIVALKLLPPEVGRDPTFAERFAREARTLARLSHNNIVHIHDSGQAGGLFYFIMEFIDGVNLRQALLAGQITPEKALAIVPQICDALQYAHEEGVIHRDIKPENVLLDKRGRIKVADFGLAKLVGNTPADFTLTGTSQAMGTLHYMAPEQMDQPQSVDHRADIYSLGVVFYELLTGRLPLGRFALPSEKLQIDIRLDEVVLKTLEREPERRYQHVSEVTTDMESISRTPATPRGATAAFGPPPRPAAGSASRMSPPATAMLVFGLLILAGTMALFLCGGAYAFLGHGGFAFLPIMVAAAVGVATAICMIVVGLTLPRLPAPGERAALSAALSPEEYEAAKRRVRGPALAMLLVALLNFLPMLVLFFMDGHEEVFRATTWARILMALPPVASAGIVIFGAIGMRDLRWYPLAIVASIVVLAPCHFAVLLGIPVGIWALVVLTRADTWQAFQARSGRIAVEAGGKPGSRPAAQPAWTPISLVALCALTPLLFIAALIMLRLWTVARFAEYPPQASTYGLEHGHESESTQSHGVTSPTPPEAVTWDETGPRLGPLLRLNGSINEEQLDKLDEALAKAYREYLAAEKNHTSRKTNELGHSVIVISPFRKEIGEIENGFWTEADSIVTDNTSRGTLRYALKFPGDIFRYGQGEATIEMWRKGTWYYVKSNSDSDYSWPELPRIYQGLWQPPEPEKKN